MLSASIYPSSQTLCAIPRIQRALRSVSSKKSFISNLSCYSSFSSTKLGKPFSCSTQNHHEINGEELSTGSFEDSLRKYFPSALTSRRAADLSIMALRERGFKSSNTLLGASICSDEINVSGRIPKCLYNELAESCGYKAFALGGLAGVPFVGETGLGACVDHVPDNGRLLLFFASHIGICDHGEIGTLHRIGQKHASRSCGAAIAAYSLIQKQTQFSRQQYDAEEEFIYKSLSTRMNNISFDNSDTMDPLVVVTYQMYGIIRDVLFDEIHASLPAITQKCDEIAFLGGIVINQYDMDDYFLPLLFQTAKSNKSEERLIFTNLYNTVFTPSNFMVRDLSTILGDRSRAEEITKHYDDL